MPNLPPDTDTAAQELAIAFVQEVLARLPATHLPTEVFQWLLTPSYTPQHAAWLAEIGRTIAMLAAAQRVTPAELAGDEALVAALISATHAFTQARQLTILPSLLNRDCRTDVAHSYP